MQTRGQSGGSRDQDDIVIIPLSTARARLAGQNVTVPNQAGSILVKVADQAELARAEADIVDLLRQRRRIRPASRTISASATSPRSCRREPRRSRR